MNHFPSFFATNENDISFQFDNNPNAEVINITKQPSANVNDINSLNCSHLSEVISLTQQSSANVNVDYTNIVPLTGINLQPLLGLESEHDDQNHDDSINDSNPEYNLDK